MKKILITGAAGYIGSCLFATLEKKYNVFGLDKIKKKKNFFFKANLLNVNLVDKILKKVKPNIIIHLAGQSTIDGISSTQKYVKNNLIATKNLLSLMKKNNIKNLIFSSTAAVYKNNSKNYLTERSKLKPKNIYGITKLKCEKIIKKSKINYVILRFFNACSSIPSLKVGELHEPETHLIPLAINKILNNKVIKIYGNNFKTKDGTCVRDYVHINDLCFAFKNILRKLFSPSRYQKKTRIIKKIINLGSGKGLTNLEVINSIVKIAKKNCKLKIVDRRVGDVDKLVCSYKFANSLINWKPQNSRINKIILDEIEWQKMNKKREFIY
jgi:UDP-glucose 4-epimerase